MSKLLQNYAVALVMTRQGLNPEQAAVFRRHLKEVARVAAEVELVAPVVISHGDAQGGPNAVERTIKLLEPLRLEGHPTITTRVLDVAPIERLMPLLRAFDEVWCATARNQSESMVRPSKVHALAKSLPDHHRFRFLHYWVEVDPETRGGTDVRPKRKPALRG